MTTASRISSLLAAFALLCACTVICRAQEERRTFGSLEEYFTSLEAAPPDSIISCIEALVASADSSSKASVAGAAFDWFSTSTVMGHDAVAVYVADRWFLDHTLEWPDEATFPLLYAYAEFNRQSLIGMSAPALVMQGLDGRQYDVREFVNRNKVLYFYDDQCRTCLQQSLELAEFARGYSGSTLYIYAVNIGGDPLEWARYVRENFAGVADNPSVRLIHLSDPQDSNDFRRKYGLLSTPAMFLLDAQNVIVGRRLDVPALEELLGLQRDASRTLARLVEDLFETLGQTDTATVRMVAESFKAQSADNPPLYRDIFYALYNYLRNGMSQGSQEGAVLVAEEYMLGRDDIWSAEFQKQIRDALSRWRLNPLGSRATPLVLQDTCGHERKMLSGCASRTLLFFHIVGCGDCRREHAALRENAALLKRKGVRVVYIYLGFNRQEWLSFVSDNRDLERYGWHFLGDPDGSSGVRRLYDVQYVPRMYLLDRRRRVIAKDIDTPTLLELLEAR